MSLPDEAARALGKAKPIDEIYGQEGIIPRLFSDTIEKMLETELVDKLGHERS